MKPKALMMCRSPQALRLLARVLDELDLGEGGLKRHLLESEAFRNLLVDPPLAAAA